jgi:hypothetical protein
VTIAGRFETALDEVAEPELEDPALLPVRLARACAVMLPVDGASLSLLDPTQHRVPLGASSPAAATAERLQFTAGDGPCMSAQESRQPVFALEEDLRRRWPVFADLLLGATPYRAVVAFPLQISLGAEGAIDLFFERPEQVPELDVFEAVAVGELVTSALSDAAVWSEWPADRGPHWLHGPAPRRRAGVWEAMGSLSMALEVEATEALDLIRARAYGSGVSADDVAAELLAGRLGPHDLRDAAAG